MKRKYFPCPIAISDRSRSVPTALVLLLGLTTMSAASAQVVCPLPTSPGNPVVHMQRIFCGEIVPHDEHAAGLQSRPGGRSPTSVTGGTISVPPGAPAGIYRLNNFRITQNDVTRPKAFSTIFPDACSQPAVLAAIRNAAFGAKGLSFVGSSGTACMAGAPPSPFNIRGLLNPQGEVINAWPDY